MKKIPTCKQVKLEHGGGVSRDLCALSAESPSSKLTVTQLKPKRRTQTSAGLSSHEAILKDSLFFFLFVFFFFLLLFLFFERKRPLAFLFTPTQQTFFLSVFNCLSFLFFLSFQLSFFTQFFYVQFNYTNKSPLNVSPKKKKTFCPWK